MQSTAPSRASNPDTNNRIRQSSIVSVQHAEKTNKNTSIIFNLTGIRCARYEERNSSSLPLHTTHSHEVSSLLSNDAEITEHRIVSVLLQKGHGLGFEARDDNVHDARSNDFYLGILLYTSVMTSGKIL